MTVDNVNDIVTIATIIIATCSLTSLENLANPLRLLPYLASGSTLHYTCKAALALNLRNALWPAGTSCNGCSY